MNRRTFLVGSAASLALPGMSARIGRSNDSASTPVANVTLVSRVGSARQETVNLGLPFAPGRLIDPACVHVVDERDREIAASVRILEFWRSPPDRVDGRGGASIRSVQIQFPAQPKAVKLSAVPNEPAAELQPKTP